MMIKRAVQCVIASLVLPAFAHAYDFSTANQLFARRAEGAGVIQQSVAAYEGALASPLSDEEQIYASEQLARLHAYSAQLVSRSNMSARAPHYESCVSAANRMQGAAQRINGPQYYFWFAACRMLWAEAKGIETALRTSKEVMEALNQGRTIDSTYEGGGFDRVLGAMYTKLPLFNPWGPAGDVRKGLRHLEASIASPSYGAAENPETATGEYFFESYWYYAQALDASRRRSDAVTQLENALARIEDGDVSEERSPETKVVEELLRELLAKLKTDF
jgi:hypothetical protein